MERLGLQIHLPQTELEQGFVNSLSSYSSNWIRISLENDNFYTNDKFHGEICYTMLIRSIFSSVSIKDLKLNSDILAFELWDETSFSTADQEFQSAINIAGLYWQGFGSNFSYDMIHII